MERLYMQQSVPLEVLAKAEKCLRQNACLTDPSGCCKISNIISKEFAQIEGPCSSLCGYKIYFGSTALCHCAVRIELKDQFRV
jgi:hypothetical protein